jgi:2-amino-4-hydroxy-6-hydroxymethyldihydropteridine diphosphokinase
VRAVIGLGGNVGGRAAIERRFTAVARAVGAWPDVVEVRLSTVLDSAPVGPVVDQPRFVNAGLLVELAPIDPVVLLGRLLALEVTFGRDRRHEQAQGPRTLDLDLLVVDQLAGDWPGPPPVALPHPRLATRAFALAPLVELLGPAFTLPGQGQAVGALLAALR